MDLVFTDWIEDVVGWLGGGIVLHAGAAAHLIRLGRSHVNKGSV